MTDNQPRLFSHCLSVYEAMAERSHMRTMQEGHAHQEFLIYRGYLTRLVTEELSLPQSYYTYVTQELTRMDCIRLYRRGGGSTMSEWLLLKTPTFDDFKNMPEPIRKLTKAEQKQEQRLKNIEERLDQLEAWRNAQ